MGSFQSRARLGVALATVLVSGVVWTPDAVAQDKIYFANSNDGKVMRANLDGSSVEDVVTGLGFVRPVFVTNGKVYWATFTTDVIQRANTDGSSIETIISATDCLGMMFDGGKIYYSHRNVGAGFDEIRRANLDGSGDELLIGGLVLSSTMCLTVGGGKIYVADTINAKIFRADLDGSNAVDIVTTGLNLPNGLALDLSGGKLYWADTTINKIQRSNLDGSSIEDLVTGVSANTPAKLSLDIGGGKVYWTSFPNDEIRRANLDGSSVEVLVSSPAIDTPNGIFVDVQAVPVSVPSSTPWSLISTAILLAMAATAVRLRAHRAHRA